MSIEEKLDNVHPLPVKKAQKKNKAARLNIEPWHDRLIVSDGGKIEGVLGNAMITLREAPAWQFVVAYDEFAQKIMLTAPPPWDDRTLSFEMRPWRDEDSSRATEWIQAQGIRVTSAMTREAVLVTAKDNAFHPVRDYLDALEHDGTQRLSTWLTKYLGVEQSKYTKAVGRAIMIGAVARVYQPGCKVDNVPIFEGKQGARKSTFVKAMFDPWFTEQLPDIRSKDAMIQLLGMWGVELGELHQLSRAEVTQIKAFLSSRTDRFRLPHGIYAQDYPRSCVFWGTTNSDAYLKDETGGRRFWPIVVGTIDLEALQRDRDQLWSESCDAFAAGEPWWLTDPDTIAHAEEEQAERYVGGVWDDKIAKWLSTRTETTVEEIMRECIGIEESRWTPLMQSDVAKCLTKEKWKRFQPRIPGGGRKRVWRPIEGRTRNERS
jgi:predicted P-loop ATPase